jgi:hypothetical protein
MAASKDVAHGMSDADKAAAYDEMMAGKARPNNGPDRYKVMVSNASTGDRTLFSSVSEKRARKYVEDHCPRGSHFFVRNPDGSDWSYEHERHTGGPQGEDVDVWQPFDRDAYQAPDLSPVSSNDPWADAWEGAQ